MNKWFGSLDLSQWQATKISRQKELFYRRDIVLQREVHVIPPLCLTGKCLVSAMAYSSRWPSGRQFELSELKITTKN